MNIETNVLERGDYFFAAWFHGGNRRAEENLCPEVGGQVLQPHGVHPRAVVPHHEELGAFFEVHLEGQLA